jgi:autotransporter-associated beta strand protein
MRFCTLALIGGAALAAFAFDADAIVYRSDSSLATAEGLADQPQFSGTGIVVFNGYDEGSGEVIAPNWVLTAKHVVTDDNTVTPAPTGVTFYYAGGNQTSNAVYTDPYSDLALVHFGTALPSSLAEITPNLSDTSVNPVGQQIWNVGYGEYGPYPGTTLTSNPGYRLAGSNVVDSFSSPYLVFSNQNTSGTEFESSTAPGDSGGPMFLQNGYQWLVVGEVYGAGDSGFIDTDVTVDSFITTTTGISFAPRAAPTGLFWTSTYLNNSSSSNTITLKTPTDGAGTWDTTRLDFTDNTYTYAWQNGTLLPVTFGVGNGAAGTVTLGSNINISNITFAATGSGNYTIAGGGYMLTLLGTGSTITTNIAATISAPLLDVTNGASPLIKAGSATLTLSGVNTYSGGTTINAGTLALAGSGNLGTSTGGLTLNNTGSTLDLGGTSQAVGDLTATTGTIITNNGTTAGTLTIGTGNAGTTQALYRNVPSGLREPSRASMPSTNGAGTFSGVLKDGTSTLALAKVGTATITLGGANTYSGGTTISGGTLALSVGSSIGTGALTFNGTSTLDLGTNAQTVSNLSFGTSTTAFTGTVTDGSLTVTGAGGFSGLNPSGTTGTYALNLSGLSAFTYNQPAQSFYVGGATSGGNTVDLTLSATSNAITATTVQIGNGSSGTLNTAQLDLGGANAINTGTLQLGGYRVGSSTLDFQSGVSNATVTLRGLGGGVTPVTNLIVDSDQNGASTSATMDVSGGTVNAIATNVFVGVAATNGGPTAVLTMGSGTMNLGTLTLGYSYNTNASANVTTSTFSQNAGTVLANTLTFGTRTGSLSATTGTTLDTLTGTYNLGTASTAGLLAASNIAIGTSTDATASRQAINFNSGTIENYDPALGQSGSAGAAGGPTTAANLTIAGITGGGAGNNNTTLTVNLASTGTHTFNAETGYSITVASTALITGAGSLTKAGGGSLTLAGTSSYTGATAVSAGAMFVNGAMTGTSGVTVTSGGVLGGNGTITTATNGTVTVAAGGQLSPGAAGVGSVGMLTFALGTAGTLNVSAATAANDGVFAFDLAATTASDSIRLTSGTLNIGMGTLGLNDFAFTEQTGFGPGTYMLVTGLVAGTLDPANFTGTVDGYGAVLTDLGTAIDLTIAPVPEPGAWTLLAVGAAGMLAVRRWRRA